MFLDSGKVLAFPLGKPRTSGIRDISSRIFYEQNVSNLIRQLIDFEGFIISGDQTLNSNGQITNPLLFNLGGYYFEISPGTELLSWPVLDRDGYPLKSGSENISPAYIYALIQIEPLSVAVGPDVTATIKEISGQDADGVYKGLEIFGSLNPNLHIENCYVLPLFSGHVNKDGVPVDNLNWAIYKNSFIKFNVESLGITGIDGKYK